MVGVDGLIFHTDDGGRNWQIQPSRLKNFLKDVFFLDRNEGWVIGGEGVVLHTIDGGQTWRSEPVDITYNLNAIYMVDRHHGWIVGDLGIILRYQPHLVSKP